jgi:hypothetical protein
MEAIELFRAAAAKLSAMRVGLDTRQQRLTVSQQRLTQQESEILVLPQDWQNWQPLTDDQGRFYLMADYDAVDAPNTVVR